MVLNRLFKLAILTSALALVMAFGGHLLPETPSVDAAKLLKYKVVSIGSANTVYEYEKLLNDMAFKGWTLDHMVIDKEWAIFRK